MTASGTRLVEDVALTDELVDGFLVCFVLLLGGLQL